MNNLKEFKSEEIVELIKSGLVSIKDIVESGICPTCFDKENNNIFYGDNTNRMIYEDDILECFFAGDPRAIGHTIIMSKKHYKDMTEIDDELCKETFLLANRVMNALKEIYKADSVYLCTMCDGKANHFHIQLIPRYSYDKTGEVNFVKPRFNYKEDTNKLLELREKLKDFKVSDYIE